MNTVLSSHYRVVLLVGVDVTDEEAKPQPALSGEEEEGEDINDNDPMLK